MKIGQLYIIFNVLLKILILYIYITTKFLIIMSDKKNIKKTTKINNKKSLNTGIIIKPSKIKNKNIVYVNNKPIDIGKKLFDLLILLINKNKRKTTRKLINKLKSRHEQHRNELQGEILKHQMK